MLRKDRVRWVDNRANFKCTKHLVTHVYLTVSFTVMLQRTIVTAYWKRNELRDYLRPEEVYPFIKHTCHSAFLFRYDIIILNAINLHK